MRRIGFSTGALALGDFERALAIMHGHALEVVELSALREHELAPLVAATPRLDLVRYQHVAVHAPKRVAPADESQVVERLRSLSARGWPVVVHPDAVHDWTKWEPLGSLLLIENMDRRKAVGRSAEDLQAIFALVPEAGFCFDVGHASQCDPTMREAHRMLRQFRGRLRQVHLSEVTPESRHVRLSPSSVLAVREVADLIPEHVPIVLESPVSADEIDEEITRAASALPSASTRT